MANVLPSVISGFYNDFSVNFCFHPPFSVMYLCMITGALVFSSWVLSKNFHTQIDLHLDLNNSKKNGLMQFNFLVLMGEER